MISKATVTSRQRKHLYAHNFRCKKTKMTWTFPVRDASSGKFLEVVFNLLAILHRYKIKRFVVFLRSDAGSNYGADKVRTYLESRGIVMQTPFVNAPHQINTAERAHGLLLPTVRSLMAFANAPYNMWANCKL